MTPTQKENHIINNNYIQIQRIIEAADEQHNAENTRKMKTLVERKLIQIILVIVVIFL